MGVLGRLLNRDYTVNSFIFTTLIPFNFYCPSACTRRHVSLICGVVARGWVGGGVRGGCGWGGGAGGGGG